MNNIKYVMVRVVVFLIAFSLASAAVPGEKGCADHPLFPTRMPGYGIADCNNKDFDVFNFETGKRDKTVVEGRCTRLTYKSEDRSKEASALAVVRNYENAIKSLGGSVLFVANNRLVNGKIVKDGKEFWVQAEKGNGLIWLTVVEKTAMVQSITTATPGAFIKDTKSTGGATVQISDLQDQIKLLEQKLSQTQQQVALLSQVIKISGANVEINAGKNLTVNAGNLLKINGGLALDITAGSALSILSNATTSIGGAVMSLKSGSSMSIEAAVSSFRAEGLMEIKAPKIMFNKANKPVATVGSSVTVGGNSGQVISGSATVYAE